MKLYNPAYNRTHLQGPCQSHLSFWPATTVQVLPRNPCLAQHSDRLKRFCPVEWPLLTVWVSVSGSASSPSQRPQKCLLSSRKHTHIWSAKMQHDNQPFIPTRISIWQMEEMSLHFFPFSPSFVPLLIVTSLLNIYFVSYPSPTNTTFISTCIFWQSFQCWRGKAFPSVFSCPQLTAQVKWLVCTPFLQDHISALFR